MTTVLLVDHPAAVLRALRESLVDQEQISIVGEASDGDRALRLAESLRPAAVVLDAEMANIDVATLLSKLRTRSPTSAFIVLTLGLLLWVINAVMLLLTSRIADALGLGFEVDGFGTALLGALIISVVGAILNSLVDE